MEWGQRLGFAGRGLIRLHKSIFLMFAARRFLKKKRGLGGRSGPCPVLPTPTHKPKQKRKKEKEREKRTNRTQFVPFYFASVLLFCVSFHPSVRVTRSGGLHSTHPIPTAPRTPYPERNRHPRLASSFLPFFVHSLFLGPRQVHTQGPIELVDDVGVGDGSSGLFVVAGCVARV